MLAVFDVHLVGGDPWWHELIGPALIAATAIGAAWIAARTANHRQQEQLNHDRDLQATQLAYDREQRERADIRAVIDDAMKGVDTAIRCLAEYSAAVLVGNEEREQHRREVKSPPPPNRPLRPQAALQTLKDESDELHRLGRRLHDVSTDLTSANLRLSLRLGHEHKIVKAHKAFMGAFAKKHDALAPLEKRLATEQDRKAVNAADDQTSQALAVVYSSVRQWIAREQSMPSATPQSHSA